ncbi:MAG: hypothetical protein GF401_00265 [Chitinivibrionales bacterium]|nr:hypothetical protein [Chitinivibrionales bacterium]
MNNNFSTLHSFIARHRRRLMLSRAVNRIAPFSGLCFLLLALFQVFFVFFPWTILPLLWDLTLLFWVLSVLYLSLDSFVIHVPSFKETAERIEREAGMPHMLLSIAGQMSGSSPYDSENLRNEVIRKAAADLEKYPRQLKGLIPFRPLLFALLALLCFAGVSLFSAPGLYTFWDLPFSGNQAKAVTVSPGSISIPANTPVTVACLPNSNSFPSCGLSIYSSEGSLLKRRLLRADSTGAFSFTITDFPGTIYYSFSLGGSRINRDTITVVPPPFLYLLQVTVTPPSYTGLAKKILDEGEGSFAAYAGSRAQFTVGSGTPLKSAALIMEDSSHVEFEIEEKTAHETIPVSRGIRYSFALADTFGQKADSLPWFYIETIPDLPPVVNILRPQAPKVLSTAQIETLLVEGIDDIGVKRLALKWRKNSMPLDSVVTENLSISGSRKKLVRKQMVWDLKNLSLYPGDTVFYWATIRDNKPFGKKQTAVSDTFWFRLPDFREIHRKIAEKESYADEKLSDVKDEQHNTQEMLSDLIKSAKRKNHLSWEEKEIIKDLASEMKSQKDSLNKALESFKEAVKQLKEEELLGDDLLNKMDEVRKTLEELVREYGDSVLFKPPEENEEITWKDMKEALQKAQRLLPELQERLDNTLKYLEMLRRDQELASLAAQAKKLAQEQQMLAAKSESEKNAAERQKNLLQRTKSFARQLDNRSMEKGADSLFSLKNIPSLEQIKEEAKSLKNQLSENATPSRSSMNRMSGSLLSLSEELQSMLSSNMMARMEKEKGILLDMAKDALNLAEWENEIYRERQSTTMSTDPARISRNAKTQQAVKEAL